VSEDSKDPTNEENTAPTEVVTPSQPAVTPKKKKMLLMVVGAVVLVAIAVLAVFILTKNDKPKDESKTETRSVNSVDGFGSATSTNPVERGKYLSYNACVGEGSKKLSAVPMKPADISIIEPYGLVAGGHVTPVDHQYYYGKDQAAAPSTYEVYAPGDGTIVSVEGRPNPTNPQQYRIVISYSCTFFSYFDLVNSLSPEVAAKMPSGYETINGPQKVNIPVKAGQLVAKIGGQSLDYAVWDTTKTLTGLLVPMAYNNKEPWKINTVAPTDYYTDELKAKLLPFYTRTVAPRDGKFDHDIDGTASGNWFKKGTNGYIGAFSEMDYSSQTYADGHLSIAPDLFDPAGLVFSTGAINHGTQYSIKNPSVTADKLDTTKGTVKYELAQYGHKDQDGTTWVGRTVPASVKLGYGSTLGTALVQLTAKRELKVEVFLGKTPAQVSAFTNAATIYTRGDEATTMSR
jgi:hypothetical protein